MKRDENRDKSHLLKDEFELYTHFLEDIEGKSSTLIEALSVDQDDVKIYWQQLSDEFDVPWITPLDRLLRISYELRHFLLKFKMGLRELLRPGMNFFVLLQIRKNGVFDVSSHEVVDALKFLLDQMYNFDFSHFL